MIKNEHAPRRFLHRWDEGAGESERDAEEEGAFEIDWTRKGKETIKPKHCAGVRPGIGAATSSRSEPWSWCIRWRRKLNRWPVTEELDLWGDSATARIKEKLTRVEWGANGRNRLINSAARVRTAHVGSGRLGASGRPFKNWFWMQYWSRPEGEPRSCWWQQQEERSTGDFDFRWTNEGKWRPIRTDVDASSAYWAK